MENNITKCNVTRQLPWRDRGIKHSTNWRWTGVDWHPHEFHFITDVDALFIGPAYTHLTFYVEVVNGVPRVAIQDGRNDVSLFLSRSENWIMRHLMWSGS